jgi:hypothetical protein
MSRILYVWGEELESAILPDFNKHDKFMDMNLMLSAWDFSNLSKKYENLKEIGIRQYLHLEESDNRLLMMDSGGFKGYSANFNLAPETVISIYQASKLRPTDHLITLDRAPLPEESPEIRIKKIEETIKNYKLMKELDSRVLQTVHGWTMKELKMSLDSCDQDPAFTLPSYNTLRTNRQKDKITKETITHPPNPAFKDLPEIKTYMRNNFPGPKEELTLQRLMIKRMLDFLTLYKERKLESRVHVLGMSASMEMHIQAFTGVFVQWDSANWRVKADNYKIMLAYPDFSCAEAYIGNRTDVNYGSNYWKESLNPYLMRCDCPICRGLSLAERKEALGLEKSAGFYNRAVHNAYHYYNEIEIARELVERPDLYEKYLDERVATSGSFAKGFWKAIKKYFKPKGSQNNLDAFLNQKL